LEVIESYRNLLFVQIADIRPVNNTRRPEVAEVTPAGFCAFFGPGVKNMWQTGPGVTCHFRR